MYIFLMVEGSVYIFQMVEGSVYIYSRWLKDQYMFLYYQDELCMGPLAVDAIKVLQRKCKSVMNNIQTIKTLNFKKRDF